MNADAPQHRTHQSVGVSTGDEHQTRQLFGRDTEMQRIATFVATAASRGSVLLVSGEAGSGKTALLAGTARSAAAAAKVLLVTGAPSETDVAYSALNQLIGPLASEFLGLPSDYQAALQVALGLGGGAPPSPLTLGTATLQLLRLVAADQPVLIIVDDLHLVDRASAIMLSFLARRLAGTSIGLLAAVRPDAATFFDTSAFPEIALPALDEQQARQLIASHFPDLPSRATRRVIAQAHGNPLALIELPKADTAANHTSLLPAHTSSLLPTTGRRLPTRQQSLFGPRLAALPEATRRALLEAALGGAAPTAERTGGHRKWLEDIAPAENAGLVQVDDRSDELTFTHPLVRSAVLEISSSAQRRKAHRALSHDYREQPDRQVWL